MTVSVTGFLLLPSIVYKGRGVALFSAAALLIVCGTVVTSDGQTKLPTAAEVQDLRKSFQAERDALIKSGAATRFLPNFLEYAEVLANRAGAVANDGRLLQAAEGYRQARWQLPYQGPGFPDHVTRVFGSLRLRHADEVLAVAYSPDGKLLATAGSDATVRIWDMANGYEILAYRRHTRYVRCLAFSPDGKWIASAGGDKDVRIWDPKTGNDIRSLKGASEYITAIVCSPDGRYVFSASDDRTMQIFDASTGDNKRAFPDFGKSGVVRCLAFSRDGTRLAAGADDGKVRLWIYPDVVNANAAEFWNQQDQEGGSSFLVFSNDGKLLITCGLHALKIFDVQPPGAPNVSHGPRLSFPAIEDPNNKTKTFPFKCAVFSKDGKTLFAGCADGVIRLYDMNSGHLIGAYKGHIGPITALALNTSGTQLVSSSTDYTARLWNFDIVLQSLEVSGHTEPIWAADFSPDGQRIISCGADRTLRTWDAVSGAAIQTFGEHVAGLTAARFSPDGKTVLAGGSDRLLRLFDVVTGKLLRDFPGHLGTITAAAFSRDGTRIVSGDADKSVIVWSTSSGKALTNIKTGSLVLTVAFTPDGKRVVAGGADRRIRLFDADNGKPELNWIAHHAAVTGLSFDAKGENLATCGFDGLVKIWSMSKPDVPVVTLSGHDGPLSAVAMRGDAQYVVSAGSDQVVKLWKNEGGVFKESQVFRGHTDWITSLAFNSNGFMILSAGADRMIRVWELASRELPLTAEHTGAVQCVAVSPDGKLLASGGTDKSIKLWEIQTGSEVRTILGHGESVVALSFSPDGKTLYTSGGDRNIRRWDVVSGQELKPLSNQQNISGFINPVTQLGLRPDGKRLIAWAPFDERGTRISIFDTATGNDVLQLNDRGKNVLCVAWTPSQSLVALGAADGNLRVYDISNEKSDKKLLDVVALRGGAIRSLSFVTDGAKLYAGCDKGEILILEASTGKEQSRWVGHQGPVYCVTASPDGKHLASVGSDNIVKLWDAATQKELRRWAMPAGPKTGGLVRQLTFTPDGRYLLTANANTTLFMLDCGTEQK